jgi:hypothetical protein
MRKEKDYKLWIRKIFDKYKSVLFLEKYHLQLEKDNKEYYATKFNFPYLDIKIIYSDDGMNDWIKDKKDAERRIIHEFCHTITDPFYCVANSRYATKEELNDSRERLTDHIAQIVNKHFNLIS